MISRKNAVSLVATLAMTLTVLGATQAQAGFTLTETGLTINGTTASDTLATVTFGGTTIGLSPNSPQAFTFGSGLNLLNVSAQSMTTTGPGDTGSFTFAETFSLVGTGTSTGLTESVTLSGTFNLTQGYMGAIISNMGTPSTPGSSLAVSVNSGSGFTLTGFGYTQPSPTSSVGVGTNGSGNVSLTIIPSAVVPEPASVALVGMGAVGVAGLMVRRRRTA
jgi:hypothetical protein